jgi:two-component system sensor histidine kinase AlgZ
LEQKGLQPAGAEQKTAETDFFLPDLCQAQSILFLVLISELLVFVMVLFTSSILAFDWLELGLASLFVQWLVLTSAALLCNIRPWLMRLSMSQATVTAYLLIVALTFVFSIVAEMILSGEATVPPEGWDHILRNIVIAAIMTGIAFRYFLLTHQLRIQEQAELASRIQALQSRIRPHFLFNSMNIIASLITIDPDLAEEVVEDLSTLFRASLNEASSAPVPLVDELDLCRKYVHIESLRLDDRLDVEWRIDVDDYAVKIPLLTIQPLLENAIYHGIQPLPEGGLVSIRIAEVGEMIEILIENPLAPASSHEKGNRMALDNIRNRMTAIYGPDARLSTRQTENTYTTQLIFPRKTVS